MENEGKAQRIISVAAIVVALMMCLYHLTATQYLFVVPELHKVLHVGFGLVLVFLIIANSSDKKKVVMGLFFALVSIGVTLYLFIVYDELVERTILPTNMDLIVGVAVIVALFLASILQFGWTLPIVAAVFVAYAILGQHFPRPFRTPDLSILDQIVPYLSIGIGTGWGIYGEVVAISANYLFLLILFGSILEITGGTRFVIGVGQLVGSKLAAGPAAVAVIGSSLLGTITGSTAANVSITGSFTIPLMKKAGYKPEQAGAIEAAASNGGQIMPPMMGAAAFVMAGFIGVPYLQIMVASILPALLYYYCVMLYVHFQAKKWHVASQPATRVDRRELLLDAPIFFIPLIVLTVLLILGRSLAFLAFWAILSALITSLIRKKSRPSLSTLIKGFARGAKSGAEIGLATALIGIVVTVFSVTGLGIKIPSLVQTLSGGILPVAMIITMLASIVLGCGVPTVPAYLLVAVTAVPALLKMGVPLLQAHYFAFFYACFSHITPPIAIGCIVACGIARSSYWGTCAEALKASAAAFLLPWIIVYTPVVILRPLSFTSGLCGIVGTVLGLLCLQIAMLNYVLIFVSRTERILFAVSTVVCFGAVFTHHFLWLGAALALFILASALHWMRYSRVRTTATVPVTT
jgi:TRAP transporter 4TM/12TM fusion protein